MSSIYPLKRRNLAACLNRLIDWDPSDGSILKDKEFAFYHRNRNFFNNKYGSNENEGRTIVVLRHDLDAFYDYTGRRWVEVDSGFHVRYFRRFVSTDEYMEEAGYKGECKFEMVVWDNVRMVRGSLMEKYNFGINGIWPFSGLFRFGNAHDKFDVNPHRQNPDYETKYYSASKISIRRYLEGGESDKFIEETDP